MVFFRPYSPVANIIIFGPLGILTSPRHFHCGISWFFDFEFELFNLFQLFIN